MDGPRLSPKQLKTGYAMTVEIMTKHYAGSVADLLDAGRRMEDSLKKLRKTRFAVEGSGVLSDDDKIRFQMALDVAHMEKRVGSPNLELRRCDRTAVVIWPFDACRTC